MVSIGARTSEQYRHRDGLELLDVNRRVSTKGLQNDMDR
jgi:hypothetical protein